MAESAQQAYCTLLMSDEYLPGAMVLAHSLKDSGTRKQLAILVTLDSLSASTIDELKNIYNHIIPVDRIVNRSPANLYLMDRPDLASTFTKIALWRQRQFSHIIYIDADVVALRAPDELFNLPHTFAAVPDIGWPDCFNSGILSLEPNMGDYYALLALAQRGISFDGADQGLLNMHFRNWERLSFTYNCTPSGNYQYLPAYRHFQSSISLVHYIGKEKPWKLGRDRASGPSGVYEEILGRWWAVYDKHYRAPTTAYSSNQQPSRTVQQYVTGESAKDYDFATIPRVTESDEAKAKERSKAIDEKGVATPTPARRKFSIDWDPMRQAPPINSRAEAPDFPHGTYEMSRNPNLFQAPQPPEPPKGMYNIPRSPAADRPKPIFPWETRARKATRVFSEDLPPSSTPASVSEPSLTTGSTTESETEASEAATITPTSPSINYASAQPFSNFKLTNAWDDVPEIDRYIASLPQNRRAKVQVLFNQATSSQPLASSTSAQSENITSPTSEGPPLDRRGSKVTDFPTEIERPSLPVTPAPVRRPSFWNAERNEAGDLPAAEGVPDQGDWDPIAKLFALRERQSSVLETSEVGEQGTEIPKRELPKSSSSTVPGVKTSQDRVIEEEGGGPSDETAATLGEGEVSERPGDMEEGASARPQPEDPGPAPMTAASVAAAAERAVGEGETARLS